MLIRDAIAASVSSISQDAIARHAQGMDAKGNRRNNLRRIIAEFGNQAAIAERLGTDAAYLSQILTGWKDRGMGSALARKIETTFRKPHGWMDQDHSASPPAIAEQVMLYGAPVSREAADLAAEWEKLEEPDRDVVLRMVYCLVAEQKRTKLRRTTRAAEPKKSAQSLRPSSRGDA